MMNTLVVKRIAALAAACVVLAACGFFTGRMLGGRFMEDIILKEGRFPLLLSRPVNRFYDVYALIHSGNSFSRLSGYYGLVDNRMVNLEFLAERLRLEQEPALRETILWVASRSGDTDGVMRLYESVYPESGNPVKTRILELMKRTSRERYARFVKENRIDAALLPKDGRAVPADIRF